MDYFGLFKLLQTLTDNFGLLRIAADYDGVLGTISHYLSLLLNAKTCCLVEQEDVSCS